MKEGHSTFLFYAGRLYASWPDIGWYKPSRDVPPEIYNGGYILTHNAKWYRCDLTPVLDEDVPLELKALCLLMGLSF